MAKVAREVVERAGVDVDQLLELLVKNASAEITSYCYSTILRFNLITSFCISSFNILLFSFISSILF